MRKNEKIQYILENNSSYDREKLEEMTKEELNRIFADESDNSDMFPNGRDYDAEDEDGI